MQMPGLSFSSCKTELQQELSRDHQTSGHIKRLINPNHRDVSPHTKDTSWEYQLQFPFL